VDPDLVDVRHRLGAALAGVAGAFQGMTAHAQEDNCECHWGSVEELALLKTPDVPLDEDLLRRTYSATDWSCPGAVLRRILPQLASGLAASTIDPITDWSSLGLLCRPGNRRDWPAEQEAALRDFLEAWWRHVLLDPDARVPAHDALAFVAEATGTPAPWTEMWAELLTSALPRRRLSAAVDEWMDSLLGDDLPWASSHDQGTWSPALSLWVLRHTADEPHELVHLLALPRTARWDRQQPA
jgi:hypothetical protein